ncbi:MAG: hypothetical protein R2797_06435 [Gelidibacter sp.]
MSQPSGVMFKVSDVMFKVSGVMFKVSDVMFKVSGVMFKVSDVMFKVSDVMFKVSGFHYIFALAARATTAKTPKKTVQKIDERHTKNHHPKTIN